MKFLENGRLYAGCNYWASHAGIMMWSDWDEEVVENDFEQIASLGIKLIRVFPLWSDFQPLERIYGYQGSTEGYSIDGGKTLLDSFDPAVDDTMMSRFERMLELADKHSLKLIPSLITGWMSGRLFVPTALLDRNLICDPLAIKWEVRFIKEFVRRFKHHTAIAAWCLGNECNCMSPVENKEQAWLWLDTLSDAFRAVDPDREVISGMHSQFTPREEHWNLQDCGESCDYITTHPYASPTYKTDRELMNSIKPLLHPAAQTIYSSGIAQRPCFIEETGTFGQMYGSEEYNAKYMEGALYTAWSHNCLAYLWWIGYDQGTLTYHPFGYNNRASNYGLFREDRTVKPVGKVIKEFNEFTAKIAPLPERITDAVCIVTPAQNTWEAAGSTFILAKQARMDITFAYSEDKLPDAKAYIIPSIESASAFGAGYIKELMQRIAEGATLYLSLGRGFPRNLADDFGFKLINRKTVTAPDDIILGETRLRLQGSVIYNTELTSATSIAKNDKGQDVFLKAPYGKGTVYLLMYPAETYLYNVMDGYTKGEYYRLYDEVRKSIDTGKVAGCDNRMIGITEHPVNENERVIVITNYGEDATDIITLSDGWRLEAVLLGDVSSDENGVKAIVGNCKTAVFKICK